MPILAIFILRSLRLSVVAVTLKNLVQPCWFIGEKRTGICELAEQFSRYNRQRTGEMACSCLAIRGIFGQPFIIGKNESSGRFARRFSVYLYPVFF